MSTKIPLRVMLVAMVVVYLFLFEVKAGDNSRSDSEATHLYQDIRLILNET